MTKKKTEAVPANQKRVMVKVPKIPGQKTQDDIVITINGRAIQIQRGVDVSLPLPYAEELKRHLEAIEQAEETAFRFATSD